MYRLHIDEMTKAVATSLGLMQGDRDPRDSKESIIKIEEALKSCWKDKMAISWSMDDVHQVAENVGKEVSEDEANQILGIVLNNFDAGIGVNWTVLELAVDYYVTNH
jgi:hypothetical protein